MNLTQQMAYNELLHAPLRPVVSRYANGRDASVEEQYHRARLRAFGDRYDLAVLEELKTFRARQLRQWDHDRESKRRRARRFRARHSTRPLL